MQNYINLYLTKNNKAHELAAELPYALKYGSKETAFQVVKTLRDELGKLYVFHSEVSDIIPSAVDTWRQIGHEYDWIKDLGQTLLSGADVELDAIKQKIPSLRSTIINGQNPPLELANDDLTLTQEQRIDAFNFMLAQTLNEQIFHDDNWKNDQHLQSRLTTIANHLASLNGMHTGSTLINPDSITRTKLYVANIVERQGCIIAKTSPDALLRASVIATREVFEEFESCDSEFDEHQAKSNYKHAVRGASLILKGAEKALSGIRLSALPEYAHYKYEAIAKTLSELGNDLNLIIKLAKRTESLAEDLSEGLSTMSDELDSHTSAGSSHLSYRISFGEQKVYDDTNTDWYSMYINDDDPAYNPIKDISDSYSKTQARYEATLEALDEQLEFAKNSFKALETHSIHGVTKLRNKEKGSDMHL
ncbi:hypothetical protein AB4254_11890 [Vibrio breoganii]